MNERPASARRRPFTGRFSRRNVIRGGALAGAGLAGAALIGCADDGTEDGTPSGGTAGSPQAGEPKSGGTIRVAMIADTNTLDPPHQLSMADINAGWMHYDSLVMRMHDFSLRPMLAESWEPSEDLSEYVVKIREGVKFHHGKTVTPEDVVYSFERLLDPDEASPAASALADIESVEVTDNHSVRFTLAGPNGFFPDTLSLYQGKIIPSDVDTERMPNEEFGTGPYVLQEYRPGERAVWRRNDEYWDAPRPYVDEVIYNYIPEPSGRLEALRAASAEIQYPGDAFSADTVEGMPHARISESSGSGYLNLAMRTDQEPFDDERVRKAFQYLTDREFIREAAIFGRGDLANDHPISPADPLWWEGQEIQPFDPEEAMSLLSAAGREGMSIDLHTSTVADGMVEMAVAFKELASQAGVTVNVQRAPEDAYWSNVWLQETFTTVQWNGRNADQALSIVYLTGAEWNEAYYENPELDELIRKGRGQPLEESQETYAEIQRILIRDVPRIIPVFQPTLLGLLNTVKGVEAHPARWLLLHDAWLDA